MARKRGGGRRDFSGIGPVVWIVLLLFASASAGCLYIGGYSSNQDLTPEDVVFLDACWDLPMGRWDATVGAELTGNYQEMYQIADSQRAVYEERMQALASMPVSDQLHEIKEEYRLADEYGMLACEYEMQRALALMEDNLTREEYLWELEDDAMDESLKHLALAKKVYGEQYGGGGFLDGIVHEILT